MGHILLIGFMGAGKSTTGRLVARGLERPFIDLDERIEGADGRKIPRIFEEDGERGFRDLESAALAALEDAPPSVIACGGGVITDESNRAELRRLGTVVYLSVSAEEALARIGDVAGRPMLSRSAASRENVAALLKSREPLYQSVADVVVRTGGRSPREVAAEVIAVVGGVAA